MHVVRPIRLDDLDQLVTLAQSSSGGITTLPIDRALLQESIERSLFAFSIFPHRPRGERYLFVLENSETGRAVGCAGLYSKTGGYHPLYCYRTETVEKRCSTADLRVRHEALVLQHIYDGPSEVSTLFLLPDQRKKGLGKLLSLSRLLFIALHRSRFEETVMASLRGVIHPKQGSAFFEHVGRHFYGVTFDEANAYRRADPRFIRDLVPNHPIYLNLLPDAARQVIGQTHPNTEAALQILKRQGFRCTEFIDILDGGPTYQADVKELFVVKELRTAPVRAIHTEEGAKHWLVSNTRLDFGVCRGSVHVNASGEASIDASTAKGLQVDVGEDIAFVPIPTRGTA